ncbi:hypothetical protein C3E88_06460 [Clostridium sp. Cult3]|nr:hypothetical protein [Clostridium sp. Cult3]MCF6460688.1 hypothetical protein [Clostridium sp. Cult3]
MYEIVNDFPNEILNAQEAPFISLYQPTHRHRPENKQDLIRYKNLVQEIEKSLEQKYPKKEIGSIMEPFYALAEDRIFWNHTFDGLAVLSAEGKCVVYNLQRPVKELAVVADSFHIKPLIRIFQSADRYHLLGLNRNEFTLYEGNRYGFEEVQFNPETPRTAKEVLGDEYTKPSVTTGTYGSTGSGIFHGHGGRKEEIDKDTEKFFRFVDRLILEEYSRPTGLPLILVSLTEHHGLFQSISHNPFLMEEGIRTAYDSLTIDELKETVWEKIEPLYLGKTRKLVEKYEIARAKFLGSDDLAQVARAAFENNIDTILIEADRIVPGKVDLLTGELERGDLGDPSFDDVLDDLAEMVFKNKGEVVVLPKERMPSDTGVAAVFRY